mmetsp:Transcript_22172/g.52520  ORF Transcript_22172/g.52520 Transcript_22172/m.52520 type:complete len:93 (-) Transcript_22172:21-299(-)
MSPLVISRLSSTVTRIPLRAKASADEEPMNPPPTTTAFFTFSSALCGESSVEVRKIKPIEGQAEWMHVIIFVRSLSFCVFDESNHTDTWPKS